MCPIGRRYVPEVRARDLSNIALDMQLSLKAIDEGAYRLAEIAVDDTVAEMERGGFELIKSQLERISNNVRELQLWAEKSLGAVRTVASYLAHASASIGLDMPDMPPISA